MFGQNRSTVVRLRRLRLDVSKEPKFFFWWASKPYENIRGVVKFTKTLIVEFNSIFGAVDFGYRNVDKNLHRPSRLNVCGLMYGYILKFLTSHSNESTHACLTKARWIV